ncbi:hypothetical protein GCM10027445_01730 [Amycolatopsis endophytica]|uniref:site-specific DNA-methyltransferase (adenine-specific) n=1 Tax=Amycolatopsis endophytica TaxID=860233 RepID=A0A853B9T4_9PSEU|nr:type ISP restriction/modification enzyme [Amycolatopsis endophytica]NYI91487.1 hypothetical protein [Amycolatopsis endophytica]
MQGNRRIGNARGSYDVDVVISDFGRAVTRKLRTGQGSPENHLRGPFEKMVAALAAGLGLTITTIGETQLPDLAIRPDYAIDVNGARVGYVELKRPGHGVPGTWSRPAKRDRDQWEKLQLLPNVLYSDGEQFAQYSFGKLQREVAHLEPGLTHAGGRLHAVGSGFARVMTDFLLWEPTRPRTLNELVRMVSRLCRLLRDDVAAEITREQAGLSELRTFSRLATDWRQVLFPNLTDAQFADQYAQTITFALLLARVEGVSFPGRSIGEIARLLGKKHSLMGRALAVLTDQPDEEHSLALTTMLRVLSVVDWAEFPDDSYEMLYEDFLMAYDPSLRRKSGVYYTPASLVSFMTRFVDDVLRERLGRRLGFAEPDVIVVDPAMGTGSFLAEVVNTVAATVRDDEGPGAAAPRLRELAGRLIGFENQAAPYAIAELRMHSLLKKRHRAEVPRSERRFLADTLDDPDAQTLPIGSMYEAIDRSRRGANLVKREEPVMVVIGNPPYADRAKGTAKWIETATTAKTVPSLLAFRKPGNGRLEYVLSNAYVYFWRWATWKAFDAHPGHPAGVVAFVCPAGFLSGPGFAGMREYLRRTADEGWIIDLTPEGHQPPMNTRFFQGNQQPICVAVFIRRGEPDPGAPALVRRTSVEGTTEQKTDALATLTLDGAGWDECSSGWSEPFQPGGPGAWTAMPSVADLFPWTMPGVKPNRTWVYAPDPGTLRKRWSVLTQARPEDRPALLKETRDSQIGAEKPAVPGMAAHRGTLLDETGPCPALTRVAHRPFDRKWVIPDARLHDRPRPPLWGTASARQIFLVEQHAHPITDGPALLFSALIPDMDCFMGHHGGRVAALYRDRPGTIPNLAPGLLDLLAQEFDQTVEPADLLSYVAAVTAHPGFTRRFAGELKVPGIRIPITRRRRLWNEAVRLGRETIWLHSFGDRCADPAAGRGGIPRMTTDGPVVRRPIPDDEDGMPEVVDYDPRTRTLQVGQGEISPVSPEVMTYRVSGTLVVKHWFGYRKRKPTGVRSSPLNDITAGTWTADMTTELVNLLHLLGRCVELEPDQDRVLDKVMNGPLFTIDDLETAGILPVPAAARKAPATQQEADLFSADE